MFAYAKPKIIMLDDDHSLLDVMEYYFKEQLQDSVLIKTFSKSCDFLTYLEEYCYLPESPSSILTEFYSGKSSQERIAKTLKDLTQLPAIIILDHELRGEKITGIDLSTTIREYFPLSYISMLTSNVPSHEAINLHNNHNIDLFLDKKEIHAIQNLYIYLSKQIDTLKNDYLVDCMDLFGKIDNLDDAQYSLQKKELLKKENPQCFLTVNDNGDIAMIQENQDIFYWHYCYNTQQFTNYE